MLNGSALLRLARLLALLLQVAIPTLGVVADARLELDSLAQPLHVESESHECDSRGHPPDCAVCHYLRGVTVAHGTRAVVLIASISRSLPTSHAYPVTAGQRLIRPARGPPHLS